MQITRECGVNFFHGEISVKKNIYLYVHSNL
jgi:hypothetical protein